MADILASSKWGLYIVNKVSSKEGSAIMVCSIVMGDAICG